MPQVVGLNNQVFVVFATRASRHPHSQHHAVIAGLDIQRRTGHIGMKIELIGEFGSEIAFRGSEVHFQGQRFGCRCPGQHAQQQETDDWKTQANSSPAMIHEYSFPDSFMIRCAFHQHLQ